MTKNQAASLVRMFQEKNANKLKNMPLAVIEGKRCTLTDEGLEARDQLVGYDLETAKSCIRQENINSEWPSMAGVFGRLYKAATREHKEIEVPQELADLGHKAVVSLELEAYSGQCYGIVELDTHLPGLWVVGIRILAESSPGVVRKPEWAFLPANKYKFGLAMKVSDMKADELKHKWNEMDHSGKFDSDCPRYLWFEPTAGMKYTDLSFSGLPKGDVENEEEVPF